MKIAAGILLLILGLPSAIGGVIMTTLIVKEWALVILQNGDLGYMRFAYAPMLPLGLALGCFLVAAIFIRPTLSKMILGPLAASNNRPEM